VGAVLDAGFNPIAAASPAANGAQLTAQNPGPPVETMAFPIDVPQGVVTSVDIDASVGTTFTQMAFAYGTNRVFALDFDVQQNVYYNENPAFLTHTPAVGNFPAGTIAVPCTVGVDDPAGAGYLIASK
jgi:hypothetical protein